MSDSQTESSGDSPVALVLGATGGIGTALCERLVALGYRLAVLGRDLDRVHAMAESHDAMPLIADATDVDAVAEAFEDAGKELGRIDAVANCVGSMLLKPAHLTGASEWSQTIATNLTSAFAAVHGAGRVMKQGGSVVLVSSVAARIGLTNHEAIAAAKAGVIGLAQSAAATYAKRGLRVNAVAPALVRTPMTKRITENERALAASVAMHPLGRIGEPGEVADTIAWLMGPASGWMTGQVLGMDGGMSRVACG